MAPLFLIFTIHQVIWPSPGTLFPTSNCLATYLIPSGTTQSRQYHGLSMV